MAQYGITRSCGHTETVQIYGTDRWGRRDRIAQREAEKLCADCRRKARETAGKVATEQNREAGLPALTGSPKQIMWAESIRVETVAKIDALRLEIQAGLGVTPAQMALVDRQGEALTAVLTGKTEARWWIDNRGAAAYTAIRSEAAQLVRQMEAGQ